MKAAELFRGLQLAIDSNEVKIKNSKVKNRADPL
jgi:hypothetical protein